MPVKIRLARHGKKEMCIRDSMKAEVEEYRAKLIEEVATVDEALMEKLDVYKRQR